MLVDGYSQNLAYYLSRLSNYSVTSIKLMPLGTTTVASNGVVQVVLPSTGILALPSFSMRFNVSCTKSTADAFVALPKNFESLIQRVGVECNGATIMNPINNYNDLFNIHMNNGCGAYGHSMLRAVNNGDVPWVNAQNAGAGGARGCVATGNVVLNITADQASVPGCINHWLGFIGTAQPQYLLADILGDLRVTLTMAGNDVLVGAQGGAGGGVGVAAGTWGMTDVYFTIDVCRIQDGVYNSMIEQRLASGVPIEIPFTGLYQFSNNVTTMSQSTKFSVSSQSLDRVICTAVATARPSGGLGLLGGRPAAGINNPADPKSENSGYFTYINNGANFNQLLVNSEYYPAFQQESPFDFSWSMKNMNQAVDTLSASGITWNGRNDTTGTIQAAAASAVVDNSGQAQYLMGKWSYVVNFKHLGSGGDDRVCSGLNSYGSASNMFWNSTASAAYVDADFRDKDALLLIFAETTSVLRCLAGKVLEIVA